MNNERKRYQEAFKRHVVAEIEGGKLSQADASREYGVPKFHVRLWLEEYGKFRPKKNIVEVVMKSEKDRIAELEKALAGSHLKVVVYEELIRQADKALKVDLKKTFGTGLSESSGGRDTRSRKSVKRSK